MSVNAINSPQPDPSVLQTQKAEQTERKTADGHDVKNDHDGDDSGGGSAPSLNASGQTVGTVISQRA